MTYVRSLLFSLIDRQWSLRSSLWFVLIAFLASFFIMMAVDPILFVSRNLSFMHQHDPEIPFESTFILLSHFYNGGIQLWDRYEQFNLAYTQLTSGVYTLSNMVTAATYVLFSWAFKYPGEALHSFHSLVWHGSNILIRTFGGFLLLRQFTERPWIILVSLIYLNSLLVNAVYSGLLTNNLYSYLPLVLFFILKFFSSFRLNDFLALLVVGAIAVANSPLFALGYFYLVVHYFLIACLLYPRRLTIVESQELSRGSKSKFQADGGIFAWFYKKRDQKAQIEIAQPQSKWRLISKICAVICLCFFILLPNFYWAQSLENDFFIAQSGIGGTEGRLNEVFNPNAYFLRETSGAPLSAFFERSLDFWQNELVNSWIFIGASTFLLSALGIIFGKNRFKWVFLCAIVLTILSNATKGSSIFLSAAHWMNAYTNPFSFLVRSFHMSALLLPTLFLPLIAMGLEAIDDLLHKREGRIHEKRILYGIGFLLLALVYFARMPVFPSVKTYTIAMALGFLMILYIGWKESRLKFAYSILAMIVIADLVGLSVFLKNDTYANFEIQPSKRKELNGETPFITDFQNPQIMPLREYHSLDSGKFPLNAQTHHGLFLHFTSFERYLSAPNIYAPRPKIYKDVHLNAKGLLNKKMSLFSFISDFEGESPPKFIESQFDLSQAEVRHVLWGKEYAIALPQDFPSYLSTTLFTSDRQNWKLTMDGRELKAAQGKLVAPWTFDVQNVRTGYLTVLLPEDLNAESYKACLQVKEIDSLKDLWCNEHDRLGWIYDAPSEGQLVIRYPFDPKWRLTVDDKPTQLHKADTYFMGFPLTKGEHKILMEYWPQSPLRLWVVVSMLGVILGFIGIIRYGMAYEQKS